MSRLPLNLTVSQALDLIPAGAYIALHSACAEPQTFLSALIAGVKAGQPNLQNLTLYALTYRAAGAAIPAYAEPDLLRAGNFHFKSFFPHAVLREASRAGLVDYIPSSFSNLPGLIRDGHIPVTVALLTVSPPDANGRCSLGVSVDYALALIEKATLLLAEINPNMPYTNGPTVPLERLSAIVETNTPLLEVPALRVGTLERQVAANVAEFIKDGSTVQLGVGTIPEAVMEFMAQRRNLNIHSGAVSDGLVDLLLSGAVTNASKPFDKGETTTSLLIGTRRLFEFAQHNPAIKLTPIDYTNNPAILAQLPNYVAVNSAIEVDYCGQVNAEAVGDWQLAGSGGQLDFVTAAWAAPGAISVIALPSVTANGAPRIVAKLAPGAPVTTPRQLAQVVVTEKGVADLRGKSLSERARLLKSLIS